MVLAAILVVGFLTRASIVLWDRPWEPHHPDEHILGLEAIALWEGITPREVGWPATTTRLALSATAGVSWVTSRASDAWQRRQRPQEALGVLTKWIGQQYIDPSGLYRMGRSLSVVTGMLQLLAVIWLLGRWAGPTGVLAGTLAMAISPIVVLHSQFVLADITGLFFATLAVARMTRPGYGQAIGAAALAALAAGSKLHFGLWLLAPLLSIAVARELDWRRKAAVLAATAGVFAWMFVALFPWIWTNPVLAIKEFFGVVAIKVGDAPVPVTQLVSNLGMLLGSTGTLVWAGALLCFWRLPRREWRELLPVVVPVVLGAFVLGRSAIVFDRYAMVLLPGLIVLAARGWERSLSLQVRPVQQMALAVAAIAAAASTVQLVAAERIAGEADVDSLARAWVLANVPRGTRVAVHDESNALLPRSPAQLRDCSAGITAQTYRDKWRMLGYEPPAEGREPFRLMLLNDELSYAYWCERELEAQTDPGYILVRYHNDARSNAVLEREAIEEFRTGATTITGGVDALVVNRRLPMIAGEPRVVVQTTRGARVIYTR